MLIITSPGSAQPWHNRLWCPCCPRPAAHFQDTHFQDIYAATRSKKAAATRRPAAKKAKAKRAARPSPQRIDVHHHIAPPSYVKALGPENLFNGTEGSRRATYEWNPGMAIDDMDDGGTRTAITSIYSGSAIAGRPDARRIARDVNEFAAQMGRDYPGRFGHFATLPVPDIDGCLAEIEYALDVLKLDGVDFRTSYGRKYLGDPLFAPIWEELDRRKSIVYTHPHEPEFLEGLIPGVPGSAIEFCTDTTRTIASLVFSGTASRFPNVRFIFSHAGGTMPFIIERFTRLARRKDHAEKMPKGVLYELKKFYYEIAQASHPGALSSLTQLVDTTHILFGTDFPYRSSRDMGKGLVDFGFNTKDLALINRGNALKLFPRFK